MDLTSWEAERNRARRDRFLVGIVSGVLLLASSVGVMVLVAGPRPVEEEEQASEVTELDLQEKKEAEPEPEPEPIEELEAMPADAVAGPRVASLQPPTEIPDDKPAEKDPTGDQSGDGGAYDPYAITGGRAGRGTGPVSTAPVATTAAPTATTAAPKPTAKAPSGPVRVTSDMTPPKRISGSNPSYPAALKSSGKEGVVVVKYVVGVDGSIVAATPVSGPTEFYGVCMSAIKTWRFEPGKDKDGNPVQVTRIARFPFKLETK